MKNKILLFSILLAILTTSAAIFAEDDSDLASVYYQSGMSLFKQNKYDEAAEKFNKALSYKKESPQVLFRLGECYEKVNETKKAIDNYRLCQKYLNQQKTPSKEDAEMLIQVSRCIDKLDINGVEFRKTKNDYLAGLLGIANDCFNKRFQRFTLRLVQTALEIDNSNKAAQKLLDKIDENIVAALSADQLDSVGPPQELFNGRDIKNWTKNPSQDAKERDWIVEGGRLKGDSGGKKSGVYMLWKGTPPEEYRITLKFKMLKTYKEPRHISIVYGETPNNTYAASCCCPISSRLAKGENIMTVSKYADRLKFTLNGRTFTKEEMGEELDFAQIKYPKIAISLKDVAISIDKITLQELAKLPPPKATELPKGIQSKKPAPIPPATKKGPVKELFNGRNLANWTATSSDPSETGCWTTKAGKIILHVKNPEIKASLLWNDPPPKNYKLNIALSIEGAHLKDKFSAIGLLYGRDGTDCDGLTFYSGGSIATSVKIEVIKNDNSYRLLVNGQLFNEFSGTAKPPVIGCFAQNIKMSISSITLEETQE